MSRVRTMAAVQSGFLVLADITGYTAYFSRSEIEHAPTIAGDLLETVVGRLEPPFRLAKLEGDAVFVFAEDGRADASLLLDAIEAAYYGFRRRLRSIDTATTCDCNACGLAPNLDLKLFVHHGSFVDSRIAGRDELAGSDVILVHRLLKGATAGSADARGFALFTRSAVTALQLDVGRLGLRETTESIEHFGEVDAFVLDLDARWQQDSASRQLTSAGQLPIHHLRATLPVDPAVAWAHLTSPSLRALWEGAISFDESTPAGRRGVGTTTRCVTGRLATIEEIVDWRPYEYVGWRIAVPGLGPVEATADLEPAGSGTQVTLRWSVADGNSQPAERIGDLRRDKEEALQRLVRITSQPRPTQFDQEVPA
jgi:hypothetical protein